MQRCARKIGKRVTKCVLVYLLLIEKSLKEGIFKSWPQWGEPWGLMESKWPICL